MQKEDLHIIKDCLQGRQEAYKKLYEKYAPYCYAICLRYSIPKDQIKDQLQIIFSSAFMSLDKYDAKKSQFKTWLSRICINKILDEKRKISKQFEEIEFVDKNDPIALSQEMNITATIDKNRILKLLEKMPSPMSEVFNLSIVDGYAHRDISTLLGITESNSRILLSRARKWAKEALSTRLNIERA